MIPMGTTSGGISWPPMSPLFPSFRLLPESCITFSCTVSCLAMLQKNNNEKNQNKYKSCNWPN